MGIDIHAFAEYADPSGQRPFSGRASEPAHFLAKFSLSRDYSLFDSLANAVKSHMHSNDAACVEFDALYPPRGVPRDLSLDVAWEYYDLVTEIQPDMNFWPQYSCITKNDAQERIERKGSHYGIVEQLWYYGATDPQTWTVIPKERWHSASWLLVHEICATLDHNDLTFDDLSWDFETLLTCLKHVEQTLGVGQARMVFWFDK